VCWLRSITTCEQLSGRHIMECGCFLQGMGSAGGSWAAPAGRAPERAAQARAERWLHGRAHGRQQRRGRQAVQRRRVAARQRAPQQPVLVQQGRAGDRRRPRAAARRRHHQQAAQQRLHV